MGSDWKSGNVHRSIWSFTHEYSELQNTVNPHLATEEKKLEILDAIEINQHPKKPLIC